MKVSLIKDKKMNAVNINMTLEASNFEKLQSFIFEIDPSAEIKVSNLEFTARTQAAFFEIVKTKFDFDNLRAVRHKFASF